MKYLISLFCILIFSIFVFAGCADNKTNLPSEQNTQGVKTTATMSVDANVGNNLNADYATGYTKYAAYEPVKALPESIKAGNNTNILVAYFSRAGNTEIPEGADAVTSASLNINGDEINGNAERIANWIADETGGDLFLIQTEYTYPFDYRQTVDVGEGQDIDGYLPAIVSQIGDISQYDTIYLVYPIWHYTLSSPVKSFLENHDFEGKTIYAFATHAGSGFADSLNKIREAQPQANVIEGIALTEKEIENGNDKILEFIRNTANETGNKTAAATGAELNNMQNIKINVQIGETSFTATLGNTGAAREFADMLNDSPLSIQMGDYSGFEKVGSIDRSLTADNRQMTTNPGDIVLYNGNQIVMFYGSNSWSYTKIGSIDNLNGWKEALGSGDVTVVFSLAK